MRSVPAATNTLRSSVDPSILRRRLSARPPLVPPWTGLPGGQGRHAVTGTRLARYGQPGDGIYSDSGTIKEARVTETSGPLAGVRVIELAGIGPGPFCG